MTDPVRRYLWAARMARVCFALLVPVGGGLCGVGLWLNDPVLAVGGLVLVLPWVLTPSIPKERR